MKKFLLGIILPVLTLVTLIGTGFATWYFNGNLEATQNAKMTVSVEKYAQVGTITITEQATKMKLDATKTGNGIQLLDNSGATKTVSAKYSQNTNAGSDPQMDVNVTVDFVVTVTIPQALQTYITVDTSKNNLTAGTGTGVFTKTIQAKGVLNSEETLTISAADFIYVKEPTTKSEYESMLSAVQNQNITIEFKATVR